MCWLKRGLESKLVCLDEWMEQMCVDGMKREEGKVVRCGRWESLIAGKWSEVDRE